MSIQLQWACQVVTLDKSFDEELYELFADYEHTCMFACLFMLGMSVGWLAAVTRLTLTETGTVKYCLMIMATMLCRGAYEL